MKKETLLRILRKHLQIKYDKATAGEWIKVDEFTKPNGFWMILPPGVNMGKLANEIMIKLVNEKAPKD